MMLELYPYCVILHFEGHKETKQWVHLKYFCDTPIQNGSLRRVWLSKLNNVKLLLIAPELWNTFNCVIYYAFVLLNKPEWYYVF